MLTYPDFDPIVFNIGPLAVHWYGLMYLLGFSLAWGLGQWRARNPNYGWNKEQVNDLIFYAALGVIIGGRLGYVVFYNLSLYWHYPLDIFKIWDGGMSFHGGLLGVVIAMIGYSRKIHKSLFAVADFLAPLVPLGLAAGRMGNFINGELWGRVTTVPWSMVFPQGGASPRHPSQLYELILEGLLLFIILWFYSSKPRPEKRVSALFLILYGVFRFILEFFREPDLQLGFIAFGWLTVGQLLCLPMIMGGIILWYTAERTGFCFRAE